ncbi:MAG: GGDEF domain-containing protein [Clostridiales bacterium]|nr:GGDEF domain-containing protein [Clostridiales bacterium]MDY4171870.1 GGDEF domain-containing protein [Evtepia sp.]
MRPGRIGGDEFAAALPKAMDEAGAKTLGERLIQAVSEIRLEDNLIGVNCSVGACWSTQPGLRYVQIYRAADQALYQAKREGKGRCCVRRIDP